MVSDLNKTSKMILYSQRQSLITNLPVFALSLLNSTVDFLDRNVDPMPYRKLALGVMAVFNFHASVGRHVNHIV